MYMNFHRSQNKFLEGNLKLDLDFVSLVKQTFTTLTVTINIIRLPSNYHTVF